MITSTHKYIITEIRHPACPTLRRIRSVRSFGDVLEGDFGGYLESVNNLEPSGNCWIYDDSTVSRFCRVLGDAKIKGNSRLDGEAYAYGSATVIGSRMRAHSRVFEFAKIFNCILDQNAWVSGHSVCVDSKITDDAVVSGFAQVRNLSIKNVTRVG